MDGGDQAQAAEHPRGRHGQYRAADRTQAPENRPVEEHRGPRTRPPDAVRPASGDPAEGGFTGAEGGPAPGPVEQRLDRTPQPRPVDPDLLRGEPGHRTPPASDDPDQRITPAPKEPGHRIEPEPGRPGHGPQSGPDGPHRRTEPGQPEPGPAHQSVQQEYQRRPRPGPGSPGLRPDGLSGRGDLIRSVPMLRRTVLEIRKLVVTHSTRLGSRNPRLR
ncbi:hypothetical protein EF879_08880 [Micromonospora sp. HM5-17]|nr:hypothetical protein EF879_08880 [Micromonospora sp. HM5-17]